MEEKEQVMGSKESENGSLKEVRVGREERQASVVREGAGIQGMKHTRGTNQNHKSFWPLMNQCEFKMKEEFLLHHQNIKEKIDAINDSIYM